MSDRRASQRSVRRARSATAVAVLLLTGGATAAFAAVEAPRQLFRLQDPLLREASGLAVANVPDLYFTVEDAGNAAIVWGLHADGSTALKLNLPNHPNTDWEDLTAGRDATGTPVLYIADTGDAYLTSSRGGSGEPRTEFAVLRVRMPTADAATAGSLSQAAQDVVRWPLVFADGKNHNSEALLVQPSNEKIFLVDKPVDPTQPTGLWTVPGALDLERPNVLQRIADVPVPAVTGGAFSADGSKLVVRTTQFAYLWSVRDDDVAASIAGQPTLVPLPRQRQGEGVAFSADGNSLLLSSEGPQAPVWQVPLPRVTIDAPAAQATPSSDPLAVAAPAFNRGSLAVLALSALLAAGGLVSILWTRTGRRRAAADLGPARPAR